jgi:hypothetical protein
MGSRKRKQSKAANSTEAPENGNKKGPRQGNNKSSKSDKSRLRSFLPHLIGATLLAVLFPFIRPYLGANSLILKTKYYAWDVTGINFDLVLKQIQRTYDDPFRRKSHTETILQPLPAYIIVTNNVPSFWFPMKTMEVVWTAHKRLLECLPFWSKAFKVQLLENKEKFPELVKVLTEVGSLPLLLDLRDYRGCTDPSYYSIQPFNQETWHIPLFTFALPVNCPKGFPIPTNAAYRFASKLGIGTEGSEPWEERMAEWQEQFPWHNKTKQAYWRGTCRFSRYRPTFIARAHEASEKNNLFNVPEECPKKLAEGSPLREPEEASMKYKIALDIDGNSWSERFPRLLCYNSAVVRVAVEDDMEEYYKDDIIAGVHFIPASLDNFTRVTEMALEDDDMLQTIVENANTWCRERIRVDRLNLDFLHIIEGYVEMLNRRDPGWAKKWQAVQEEFMGPANSGGLVALPRVDIAPNNEVGTNVKPWVI